jgi:hypothetical protein
MRCDMPLEFSSPEPARTAGLVSIELIVRVQPEPEPSLEDLLDELSF